MSAYDLTLDPRAAGEPQPYRLRARVLFGALVAALLVGGCGYWAATATLSGAIIATGTVKVDEELKLVQHRDGGIVAAIAVAEGQRVAAGDVLVSLDDTQIRAELGIIVSQMQEIAGRRARLIAERDGLPAISFPPEVTDPAAGLAQLMAGETQLFTGNVLNRTRQKEQLSLQVEQLGQEKRGLEAQLEALDEEIGLVEAETDRLTSLAEDGLIEGSRVYAISRELVRMQGQHGELEAAIARVEGRAGELALQILAIDETARTEAQRELRQLDAMLAELDERRVAVEDRLARTAIRAPIGGTINELNVTTIGGVVSPAEPLVTIVPEAADLTIEVKLATTDVDQIAEGQPVKVRFSAFNQRTTPEFDGTLVQLSPASQRDTASGASYYVGRVALDEPERPGLHLRPGMPVEAFIETAQLTAISYLLKPLTDQFARAFREE